MPHHTHNRKLYQHPVQGIPMIEPEHTPEPGQIIIGYEVIHDHDGFFTQPDPKNMNNAGWASVIIALLCFWPATCVPCCLSCSYNKCQRPVYGFPLPSHLEQTQNPIQSAISLPVPRTPPTTQSVAPPGTLLSSHALTTELKKL